MVIWLDIVPIVMAGILGIYGLVVSVLIANTLSQKAALYTSLVQLGAGLSVGLCGLAAGYASQIFVEAQLNWTALRLESWAMRASEERRSSLGFT
ncbi:V-type proton ATPase 16 kDa proteolipid subunit [Aspergillus viridinutans]|uniref:V-type proton ATPase 16 kDa proteolipid subunit n=1 Tax=Aspergillus viridinutans TaxID=75553 RepID=A0A9P3BQW3_ASPVI|nr:V-type proton ATPase 16 kDa proteolipid subunit [Aspergillus viridinutans]GIK00352.1 V-type proton ATPase 16 kDa proteolipid subunit [Aspergillus viridinutans]